MIANASYHVRIYYHSRQAIASVPADHATPFYTWTYSTHRARKPRAQRGHPFVIVGVWASPLRVRECNSVSHLAHARSTSDTAIAHNLCATRRSSPWQQSTDGPLSTNLFSPPRPPHLHPQLRGKRRFAQDRRHSPTPRSLWAPAALFIKCQRPLSLPLLPQSNFCSHWRPTYKRIDGKHFVACPVHRSWQILQQSSHCHRCNP